MTNNIPASGMAFIRNAQSGVAISYLSLESDIERLVSMKASMYNIPGFERDDVAQEIRMTCVKALAKYDTSKNHSTPFHFLARCVDNRLRNLIRDNAATLPKSKQGDERSEKRIAAKRLLHGALSVGFDVPEDLLSSSDFTLEMSAIDFKSSIEELLPDDLLQSFQILLKNGAPSIPKGHLKLIKKIIREQLTIEADEEDLQNGDTLY
jgi:DNA-directed RNA polymerase specialized sigma24 family protein